MREHGTQAKYRYDNCRCEQCKAGQRRADKQRKMGRAGLVDAAEVRAFLVGLKADRWSDDMIAARCGTSASRVRDLIRGRQTRLRMDTARRILGGDFSVRAPGTRVPIHGARRRLQALARLGWPIRTLAEMAGVPDSTLGWVAVDAPQRRYVWQSTHDVIAGLFEELSGTLGPSELGRNRAASRGWLPPLAWDDIDDPDEVPDPAAVLRVERPAGTRRVDRDELVDLLGLGFPVELIADRFGTSPTYIRELIRDHGLAS